MNKKIIKYSLLATCIVTLVGCSGFFDKDNTPNPWPLTTYKPEINPVKIWSTRTGAGSGSEYLKMRPSLSGNAIYTAGNTGTVTAINKQNGRTLWSVNTKLPLSAGPGANNGIVVVGSSKGDVLALSQATGGQVWKTTVPGEILAQPAVAEGIVVIKSIDGHARGFSATNGQLLWDYQQTEPNLILHGSSAPLIEDNSVIAGFANGTLAKLNAKDGQLAWQQAIAIPEGAFSIQRMIDIDADPVLFQHDVYVATYQGKISSLDWNSGRVLWSHDISSYTGMVADASNVYISDAKSHVWSFGADGGFVNWRQNKLEARTVSGPAIMGNYVVVGDGQGYLHWLDKTDGHFAGRVSLGSGIYAAPIVENGVLYAQTTSGYLAAYSLR